MTPLSKCVSLETAKRLLAAGFPQDTERKYCGGHDYYHENDEGKFEECDSSDLLDEDEYCNAAELTCEYFVAAPDATEIGELLPPTIEFEGRIKRFGVMAVFSKKVWVAGYDAYNEGYCFASRHENEAEARADCWLWLKENNLI